ncbi:MAG TPA: hypothetical protein PKA99_13670 [Dermatophilaceae bacterium]|nr:hypothetical protein [Dermatophilaceae bacterium]
MGEIEWELRCTIYADGKRVGTCDVLADSLPDASWNLSTELATGGIQMLTRHGRKVLDHQSTGQEPGQ